MPKNQAVTFDIYGPLTLYKKSEKTNEPIPWKVCHAQMDGCTDGPEFIGPFPPKVEYITINVLIVFNLINVSLLFIGPGFFTLLEYITN